MRERERERERTRVGLGLARVVAPRKARLPVDVRRAQLACLLAIWAGLPPWAPAAGRLTDAGQDARPVRVSGLTETVEPRELQLAVGKDRAGPVRETRVTDGWRSQQRGPVGVVLILPHATVTTTAKAEHGPTVVPRRLKPSDQVKPIWDPSPATAGPAYGTDGRLDEAARSMTFLRPTNIL